MVQQPINSEKSDSWTGVRPSPSSMPVSANTTLFLINANSRPDIRTNEFYTNEQLFELIKEKVHCEIKARSFRLSSTRTDLDHPFVRRAILMGKEPFGSPTLSDQALMRFPSVKIGPGNSARSHSADEYIKGPEIREAIDTYVRLLNGLQL